ncbi:MAG: hypothetical protein K6B71_03350 [Alphaproteobacteria bacterium]|nr:hypothetical protein [Alphaproteobacteria bacterium]
MRDDKKIDIKSKIRKFLAGISLIVASIVGGHKTANAQEFNDMTDEEKIEYVINMTPQEKNERLAEIKLGIDSLDKVIAVKQENYDLVKDFVMERFSFEEYNKKKWAVSVCGYIRDDIIKNIDDKIKTTKDSAQIFQLEKEKNIMMSFFHEENRLTQYDNVSIAFMANWLEEEINRNVRDNKTSPEEAKLIAEKLNPYLEIKQIPTASKSQILYSELVKQSYSDLDGLRTSYMNGEISPEEYTKQKEKFEKIYDLLFRLLKAIEKDGSLKSATSQYYAFLALKNKAESSLRFSQRQKGYLLEEQNTILVPPVIQNDTIKKAKTRAGGRS